MKKTEESTLGEKINVTWKLREVIFRAIIELHNSFLLMENIGMLHRNTTLNISIVNFLYHIFIYIFFIAEAGKWKMIAISPRVFYHYFIYIISHTFSERASESIQTFKVNKYFPGFQSEHLFLFELEPE